LECLAFWFMWTTKAANFFRQNTFYVSIPIYLTHPQKVNEPACHNIVRVTVMVF
jgi:hypothetical protein